MREDRRQRRGGRVSWGLRMRVGRRRRGYLVRVYSEREPCRDKCGATDLTGSACQVGPISGSPCASSGSDAFHPLRRTGAPVEVVSDEEMALIESVLALAAACPLLSSFAARRCASLSRAACSATGDIEDPPLPLRRSLLARFRERRAFAITATEWCDKQMEFVLEHGRPERTEAMKACSDRHAQLEKEVIERVDAAIRSAEELWAVKFMNFIMGTNQLLFDGITRELPVIGVIEGFMDGRSY